MELHITIPQSWKHVTPPQLKLIAAVMAKPFSREEMLTHIFLKLAQWRVAGSAEAGYIFKSKQAKRKFLATSTEFTTYCNSVAFTADGFTELSFAPRFFALTAPNPLLFNTTFEQYMQADNLHNAYIASRKAKYINRLIATYWTRKGKAPRRFFSAKNRMQAFIWFTGVKHYMAKRYPALYSGAAASQPNDPAAAVISILSALNGGDVTKNESILKSHIHEVFHELNILAEQYQKQQQNVYTI